MVYDVVLTGAVPFGNNVFHSLELRRKKSYCLSIPPSVCLQCFYVVQIYLCQLICHIRLVIVSNCYYYQYRIFHYLIDSTYSCTQTQVSYTYCMQVVMKEKSGQSGTIRNIYGFHLRTLKKVIYKKIFSSMLFNNLRYKNDFSKHLQSGYFYYDTGFPLLKFMFIGLIRNLTLTAVFLFSGAIYWLNLNKLYVNSSLSNEISQINIKQIKAYYVVFDCLFL